MQEIRIEDIELKFVREKYQGLMRVSNLMATALIAESQKWEHVDDQRPDVMHALDEWKKYLEELS